MASAPGERSLAEAVAGGLRRLLRPRVVRLGCIAVLGVTALLLAVSLCTPRTGPRYRTAVGADYAAFYLAGQTLNNGEAAQLYDLEHGARVFYELLPGSKGEGFIVCANPPHFALMFRPLAMLPFEQSCLVWGILAFGMFVGGFFLLRSALPELAERPWGTPLLLLISWEPVLMESTLGGQVSAWAFLWLAAGLWAHQRGRGVLAGLAMSMLLYKPTWLVLLPAMLLVGRQWRVLVGLVAGVAALGVVSVVAVGPACCAAYVKMLLNFGGQATAAHPMFRTIKYIDITAFFHILMPGENRIGMGLAGVVGVAAAGLLAWCWWRYPKLGPRGQKLIWAATVAWLPVVNVYGPVYDTVVVALAMMLAAAALMPSDEDAKLPAGLYLLLALVYVTPWWAQRVAQGLGVQCYTLLLVGVGGYLMWVARVQGPAFKGSRARTS